MWVTTIALSVLDQSPIRSGGSPGDALNETVELARLCEQWGYHRFWVSEHHASAGLAGCSPEVLLARLGAETERIRLGSGGVMLPYYSPYKVAENFKLLAAMYGDRIDLGVGRAPGSTQYIAAALGYGSTVGPQHFPQMVADLEALLRDAAPVTPGMEDARAFPRVDDARPGLWMLGSSEDSAHLAASMGLPYSFAHFINANIGEHILETYREHFKASKVLDVPYASLAVSVTCAATEQEARRLALSRELWFLRFATQHEPGPIPSVEEAESYPYSAQERAFLENNRRPGIIGSPEQVKAGLLVMAEQFHAEEMMIVSITHDFEARCRSHQLVAEAWAG